MCIHVTLVFSKDELFKKITELNIVEFPKTLIGFSCSKCLTLNCSTDSIFELHMLVSCQTLQKRHEIQNVICKCSIIKKNEGL